MSGGEKQARNEAKQAAEAKWNEATEALKAFSEARDKEKEPPDPQNGSQ